MELTPKTRKETFLAAAGGQDVTTPTPVTREEVFLNEIAKGGGSSLPSTETASAGDVLSLDDNKEPQWAAPSGSGGGVLVVNMVSDETGELDKTWKEISDAGFSVLKHIDGAETVFAVISSIGYDAGDNQYYVTYGDGSFVANSQTDYPAWS